MYLHFLQWFVVNYLPNLILELVYMDIKIPVHFYHSKIRRTKSVLLHKQDKPGAEGDSKACGDNVLTDSSSVP